MVQCEMCGAETASPNTVKVEGAELDVCDECSDFGTEVRTESSSSTSTKYSTSSSSSSDSSSGTAGSSSSSRSSSSSSTGTSSGSGGGRSRDMFDELDEVAQDYDKRIRQARESANLSQEDFAKQLNEKASLIRKLEQGDTLPSDEVQRKIEREFDIDLTEGAGGGDTEWEGGSSDGTMTLGDKVQRKDS